MQLIRSTYVKASRPDANVGLRISTYTHQNLSFQPIPDNDILLANTATRFVLTLRVASRSVLVVFSTDWFGLP
jgi:hypothetical protein